MFLEKKILLFFLITTYCFSQKQYAIRTIAFYNVENLFDTINDTSKKDELSPMMKIKQNRSKIYWDKIDKLSSVILQIGSEKTNDSPAILGIAEIENESVLQDLIAAEKLRKKHYEIIHFDSPDARGIDVALLYQPNYFKPIHYEVFNPNIYVENKKIKTRDILWVNGFLDGEEIMEQIREQDNNAKIIIMGDFNDDPTNTSLKKILKTKAKKQKLQEGDIYNPYEKMFKKGLNTLGYRDNINLFDQILINTSLTKMDNNDFSTYKMFRTGIFNKPFLTQNKGRFKGYPFKSFSNNQYTYGYSDHYPVFMYLIREKR